MKVERWYQKEIDEMITTISSTKSKEEVEKLFGRILTAREINDMARRLAIWRMLEEGFSYSEIQMKLGAGAGLVSKISNQIGFGYRRSSTKVKIESKQKRQKRPTIKYKGVTPIHRMFTK